jgi:hypothetical protein
VDGIWVEGFFKVSQVVLMYTYVWELLVEEKFKKREP